MTDQGNIIARARATADSAWAELERMKAAGASALDREMQMRRAMGIDDRLAVLERGGQPPVFDRREWTEREKYEADLGMDEVEW